LALHTQRGQKDHRQKKAEAAHGQALTSELRQFGGDAAILEYRFWFWVTNGRIGRLIQAKTVKYLPQSLILLRRVEKLFAGE
jgi:hypothetical protein